MKKKFVSLLDCTLRDGGYYNNWDFSPSFINKYLQIMSKTGVDVIEIGFKTLDQNSNYGACAYSNDNFINTLNIPKNIKIAVMVNASDLIKKKFNVLSFFKKKKLSKISIIRIAAHYSEIKKLGKKISELKKLGYKVFLNLMQISERKDEEIQNAGEFAQENKLDVLYFADSMGSLESSEIKKIINLLKNKWKGDLGIHTHDNMSRAVINSRIAFENGVKFLDCTVDGMGRGPGNAKTEYLILEYKKYLKQKSDLLPLLDFISNEVESLRLKYKWGTNPFYYLSGIKKIHPTFIQTMLGDKSFKNKDILSTINYISKIDATRFNRDLIYRNAGINRNIKFNTYNLNKVLKNKNVLIIGSGESVIENKKFIEKCIKDNNFFTIALNTKKIIKESLINLRVVSNELRFLTDRNKIKKLKQRVIMPYDMLSNKIQKNLNTKKIVNFGLKIKKETFKFEKDHTTCPNSLAISYAIGISNCGRAKKIYLAGIDGFGKNDPKQIELIQTFDCLKKNKSIPIFAITKSNLNIPYHPIFKILK